VEAHRQTGRTSHTQILLAFAAVYIIWGSTYLAIRFAIETLPPFLMAGVRFVAAGLILFVIQRARSREATTVAQWRSALIIGACLIGVGNGAVVWAELRIPSGMAAMVVAVAPCWMVLFDWLWHGNAKPTFMTMSGLLLGFGGLALLVIPGLRGTAGSLNLGGIGAIMFGTVCWTFGSIYSKRAPLPKAHLLATAMEMLCGGALLIIAGIGVGELHALDVSAISLRSVLAMLYLMVFGSLIAFTAYVWLLHKVSAAQVSTYAYVNPLVAVLLGWILAGEKFTPTMAAASAAIIAGVVIITLSSRRDRQALPERASHTQEPSRAATRDRR
jgi:drug/metabolite transporter (DMT)-like permease